MELESLVVSAEVVAKEKIAGALHGLITIVKGSGEILPDRALTNLDGKVQILSYLLACRASVILGFKESADATAEQIASALGMDVQRTREALSRLKRGFVQRTARGYDIPIPRITAVCEEIVEKRGGK